MNKIKKITIPIFLKKDFIFSHFKAVNIDRIYVGLINSNLGKIKYINIKKTPHYYFVCDYLGIKNKHEESVISYCDYIKSNPLDLKSKQKFIELINLINKNGYNFKESPILVFKTFKRPFPFGRFDVADGFHRLSILAALDSDNVNVAVIKRKQSIFMRLKKIFNEIYE
tara:strand:+ start:280 stop:786 length:507 start_codon:yes stop_codon:yes gene_type:complete